MPCSQDLGGVFVHMSKILSRLAGTAHPGTVVYILLFSSYWDFKGLNSESFLPKHSASFQQKYKLYI